jgi:outer membrane receptor protein involved in Fe transport
MVYYDYHPEKIVSLAPEITYSYEAGIKGHTKYGHLSYALAFYYFDWKHFQTMLAGLGTSESGTLTYVYDDNGLAYGAGTELTGTYTFNPNVSIYSDFAYCGGTFADKDMNGNVQNNSGNQFAMTPRYMYDLGLNWKHLLPNGKTIYFYPSLYAQSKMYFDEINNPAFMQRSYLIANANAGVQWTRGRITFDVGLYGQNITNTKYIVEAGSIGEVIGMPTYVAGQPATVYLSYRMHIK